jgi:hypothetical protein
MYITNDSDLALIAEKCGVSYIFVDLEIKGKIERQGNLDTVISRHNIMDIKKIRAVLTKSKLLVRCNPVHDNLRNEIDKIIEYGADMIMLPYFKTIKEVEEFLQNVNHRVATCLLCETIEAVELIDDILMFSENDCIYVGLNDLHLSYKQTFMFEPLANGTIENLANKFRNKNITFGFGGIARLGEGMLPAEYIIAEHYRLGSSMAILSRAFLDSKKIKDFSEAHRILEEGVDKIRQYEDYLSKQNEEFYLNNKKHVNDTVKTIVGIIKDARNKEKLQ